MKNWPWQRFAALSLILFALFYFFYYKPRNTETQNIRAERVRTENEVLKLRQQKKQMDAIESELENLTTTLRELETIIPQSEEISGILRQIQEMAYESRVNIIKFIPQNLLDAEFYSEKPILIELEGNYHNLAMFFDKLSRFPRLFTVEDFSIKSMPKQSDDITIAANSTAKTYVFHEKSGVIGADSPGQGRNQ